MASPKEAEVLGSGASVAFSPQKDGVRLRPGLASPVGELAAPVAAGHEAGGGKVPQNRCSDTHHEKAEFSSCERLMLQDSASFLVTRLRN